MKLDRALRKHNPWSRPSRQSQGRRSPTPATVDVLAVHDRDAHHHSADLVGAVDRLMPIEHHVAGNATQLVVVGADHNPQSLTMPKKSHSPACTTDTWRLSITYDEVLSGRHSRQLKATLRVSPSSSHIWPNTLILQPQTFPANGISNKPLRRI